jgi:hypothetical protein
MGRYRLINKALTLGATNTQGQLTTTGCIGVNNG